MPKRTLTGWAITKSVFKKMFFLPHHLLVLPSR